MPRITIHSPIDDRSVGTVPAWSKRRADRAVKDTAAAQPTWAARPLTERLRVLKKAATELRKDVKELSRLLTLEVGKAPQDAREEVLRTADLVEMTVDEAKRLKPDVNRGPKGRVQAVTRVPWGVVLAIGPFNFPVNLTVSKIAPALAMGNAVILKPSTQGSLAGLRVARAFYRAGVPRGALAVATGSGADVGDYLAAHPGIGMIAMTGSTAVGQRIVSRAGMIPILMELGGNDPAIVLPDADLDLAADCIVTGAFRYYGQRCTAVKRVYVPNGIADKLVGRIVERTVERYGAAGDPREGNPLGPVINDRQAAYLEALIKDARRRGGKVLTGGTRSGRYVQATVIDRVPHAARLVAEEQFGPVLPIIRVRNAAEALKLANDTDYGLQASVFTRDRRKGERLAEQIQAGGVHINGPDQRGPDNFMFTGHKASGLGAQGVRYALEAMGQPKGVVHNPGPRSSRTRAR